ncbi:MAG: phospholipid/cholesterol/gamma-HCH transport system substrate-binding protein, partial [Actinomycetota bacterium]|nr:phospholipid/cholesterol/gamma-HCH transport system substrate-binding protein [Actinomycetota bacterium]
MRVRIFAGIVTSLVVAGSLVGFNMSAPDDASYTITADVTQAPNLFAGGRVMVRGVEVGEITGVEPRPEGVRLTLRIDDGVKIPADATLSIVPITVIADRYVQLFPAYKSGPLMADGDHIPVDRTAIPAELDDVLGQLKGLLGALEPRNGKRGPLATLVESLDEALDGKSNDLAGTLSSASDVLENLADSQADITGLISNLDKLFLSLADSSSEIGLVNERFALVAEALASDQDNLEGTIENLAQLADETASLLSESGDKLGESFGRLGDVLRVVLSHEKQLTEGARWANVISQALGEVDGNGKGRYAYSGRQAPPGTE